MSKPVSNVIKKQIEKTGSNSIVVFTNHLKIDGLVYYEDSKCDQCHDDILTLTDVMVCRLSDYCTCDDDSCGCNDYVCFRYDWLNININSIAAYSIVSK